MRQCLKRRLLDIETLEREVDAWCTERNRPGAGVEWRFTVEDARIKLRILYQKQEGDRGLATCCPIVPRVPSAPA